MDLSELEVLVAVAQEKGFSRAAERLGRTQPAVSQAIRRLEDVGGGDPGESVAVPREIEDEVVCTLPSAPGRLRQSP